MHDADWPPLATSRRVLLMTMGWDPMIAAHGPHHQAGDAVAA